MRCVVYFGLVRSDPVWSPLAAPQIERRIKVLLEAVGPRIKEASAETLCEAFKGHLGPVKTMNDCDVGFPNETFK